MQGTSQSAQTLDVVLISIIFKDLRVTEEDALTILQSILFM